MSDKKDLYNLLDKTLDKQSYTTYKKGDMVEAVVQKVSKNYLIVKIDNAYDAVVPSGEMAKTEEEVKVGDTLKVFVMREDEYGNMMVSQTRTTVGQRWDMLEEAYKNDLPILVTVLESNNGGIIVTIDGVTGFIPTSQLDPNKVYKAEGGETGTKDDMQKELSRRLADLIGTKITVKVVEIDKEKNRVIFSEKNALTDQSAELRSETIRNAKIGQEMDATVTAVTPYGIFVNAGGLDGLVHVSEISWDKVESVNEVAKVGEKIRVKLIDISEDGKRVAYSIKQLSTDPWNEVSLDFTVGSKVKGTITEIEDYGVILKIADGVTGLIHRSELSDKNIGDPKDLFKVGQDVEAIIMTISPSERKMGLSIKRLLTGGGDDDRHKERRARKPKEKTLGSLDIAGALEKAGISSAEAEVVVEETKEKEADTKEA